MLSWIQYHILLELTRHASRRYSALRPRDVEGNLFMYHLKGIMREKLVEKADDGQYRLTRKGLQFASMLSLSTGRTRQQPQLLNAVVCRNDAGEYLLVRWKRQPNTSLVSLPHGMMHFGEPVLEAAVRELAEKTGMTGDITHRGMVYLRGQHDGAVDRHWQVQLFDAVNLQPDEQIRLRTDASEHFWSPLDALHPEEFVPGFYEIIKLLEQAPQEAIFADLDIPIN